MKTISATVASRGFSEVLDSVERGETIRITRDGRPVAEMRPIAARTGRALRAALAEVPALDESVEADIAAAVALATSEVSGAWPEG